jgi:hypothetical protein
MTSYYCVVESSVDGANSLGTFQGFDRAQEYAFQMARTLTPDGLSVVNVYRLREDGDLASLIPEITFDPREARKEI